MIADQEQRIQALNPEQSFIVQAPAGSGKTELLTRRILRLLTVVQKPEEILAITFTRKAAAEMRARLLEALEWAQGPRPEDAYQAESWQLAQQVLRQSDAYGWDLPANPGRLAIQTMDSFNASLVSRMPWLSRLGGVPRISDRPDALYLDAAAQLLSSIERGGAGEAELKVLLQHQDNRLDRLRDMIAVMLSRRDQWLHCLPQTGDDEVRAQLEDAVRCLTLRKIDTLAHRLSTRHFSELRALGSYAVMQLPDDSKRPLMQLVQTGELLVTGEESLPFWLGIADLCLTRQGSLRKRLTAADGFPAKGEGAKEWKDRALSLLAQLEELPGLTSELHDLQSTASFGYTDDQWEVLKALLHLLPLAVHQLRRLFQQRGEIDFAEMSFRAGDALGSVSLPTDLLLQLDQGIGHILVDEFQDTSRMQYELLLALTEGWTPGDGRTLFLVGDPMQSIYRFREAEVGFFLQTMQGRLGQVQLTPLQLCSNFRSQQGLVDWCNQAFSTILAAEDDPLHGAVAHAPSVSHRPANSTSIHVYPQQERDDTAEAVSLVHALKERLKDRQATIGVLVRSRSHLQQVARQLIVQGVPFQAQDIDPLANRPIVQDLVALTQALLHPGDRLNWLAVLRAPWCGLTLSSLHHLCGAYPDHTLPQLLARDDLRQGLEPDEQVRLQRVSAILLDAVEQKGRVPLRSLVETCWLTLGGPACYSAAALEDAESLFVLLEELEQAGDLPSLHLFKREVERLFARPDPNAPTQIQLMTIHKAKGLEFDHVFLPGLGKTIRDREAPLLRWVFDPNLNLLMAPISRWDGTGDKDPLYDAIARIERERQAFEEGRLLYVACTRARETLSLFGHAVAKDEQFRPASASFLARLWPQVEHFWSSVVGGEADEKSPLESSSMLHRLPLDWSLPEWPSLDPKATTDVRRASDRDESLRQAVFTGYEAEMGRHVGTLVHELLERIGNEGIGSWPASRLEGMGQRIDQYLISLGVVPSMIESARQRVMKALTNAVTQTNGRWVLHAHAHAVNEWAIGGELEGQRVHAMIDRSFIDSDGVRCIVDYKTSAPGRQGLKTFLEDETDKYRSQMDTYRQLLEVLEPDRVVRCFLYFPLIDHLESL